METHLELHQKQTEFIDSTKRYKLLNWGRRSGKTFSICYEIFIELYNRDKGLVSYYAPTRDDARSIVWEDLKDLLEPITLKTNESLLEIEVQNMHGTTSLVRLAGWEAVKNRDKGRGVENNLVVLDEAAFFPMFREKFEKVIEPTLLTSKGRLIVASTPNGFNHFYDMAQQAQASDEWFYSHATSYDNPFNDPNELDRLKAQKPEDSFAQEYLADFRKLEGLVYKEFDRNRHLCFLENIKPVDKRGCVDFGLRNPTAMYEVWRDAEQNYYITNEFYKSDYTQEDLDQIIPHYKVRGWYADPEAADRIEHMRRKGHRMLQVSKAVEAGVDTVQGLFKQNRLFIDKSCIHLIEELESYRYPERRPNSNEREAPIKENDHACDAIRYALHNWEATAATSPDLTNYYKTLQSKAIKPGVRR